MKVLVTGMAGFIGHAVARRLSGQGHEIVGVDNLNDYYEVALKLARLDDLASCQDVRFQRLELADRDAVAAFFATERFERVIHLAAQAGVRHSLDAPHAYVDSNLVGFLNVLEGCRRTGVGQLLYASSSSVYGTGERVPFSTDDPADRPVSLYAATKRAGELMAYSYAHLYGLPAIGLRFFTVYGPWGRPDMAPWRFTRALLEDEVIPVFNHGDMQRDFTYIDDIAEAVARLLIRGPVPSAGAPHELFNIGHGSPMALMAFIHALEVATGHQARLDFQPMQPGDVPRTWADSEPLFGAVGYRPGVSVEEGVTRLVAWYRAYHGLLPVCEATEPAYSTKKLPYTAISGSPPSRAIQPASAR